MILLLVAEILARRDAEPVPVLLSLKLSDATGDCVDEDVFSVLNVTELLVEKVNTLDEVVVPQVDDDLVGKIVVVSDKEIEPLAD